MRDYAELVTRLKQSDDNCNAECCECSGECLSSSCNIFSEAADAIEELLAKVPNWISVEDRLPKPGERVLITNGSFVCESYQSQGKRWMRHGCYMDYMQPTHWMPPPTPPKEVTGDA